MNALTALAIGWGVFWTLLPGFLIAFFRLPPARPMAAEDYDVACLVTVVGLCWTVSWAVVRGIAA